MNPEFATKLEGLDLPEDVKNKIAEMLKRRLRFLFIGRSGVGKSHTINSLFRKEVAKVGKYHPTTLDVTTYDGDIHGIEFTFIDSPGLADSDPENDQKYIELIKSKAGDPDLFCFVTRLNDTRVSRDEQDTIKVLSKTLSSETWKRSLIIFTHANSVPLSDYPDAKQQRSRLIQNEFSKHLGAEIGNAIPSVCIENTADSTPDGKPWRGELLTASIERLSDRALPGFLQILMNRDTTEQVFDPAQIERVGKRVEKSIELKEVATAGGMVLAEPV